MADTDLVRPSRDGDQFHYLRAARLCLEMLTPNAKVSLVTVEGTAQDDDIRAGIDVIDLALYYGDKTLKSASKIRYLQFKHSTRHANKEWTASGLKKSIEGFVSRYKKLCHQLGSKKVADRVRFEFETNRPIKKTVEDAIGDIVAGSNSSRSAYLRKVIDLEGEAIQEFAKLIRLTPNSKSYLTQRSMLESEFRVYLPDNDKDAPLRLKDLITRKATTEFETNPEIRRQDVLEAIGASEADLFPAPQLIDMPEKIVDRESLSEIVEAIIEKSVPTIIQADGGVGKSVLAMRLGEHISSGSLTFVYDCFGNGGYRSASEYRHRPCDGLVQIANEMAGAGLCYPLVPTGKADDSAYVRAFMARVTQVSQLVSTIDSSSLLCLIVDAADNAETAAEDDNTGPSFPRLLLREKWPENVRIVLTARPHRTLKLDPPPETQILDLEAFSEKETRQHLQGKYPGASDSDIKEFHRLTSQNPRVQAAALSDGTTLREVLDNLGPTPKTVDDMIGQLLENAVRNVRYSASKVEQQQIDQLCAALATLRPFVPLEIIAATAQVPVELVRSFANDLRRPLLVREDAIQFRDEPTETWFRQRFRPPPNQMGDFVARLRPFAATSPYAAAVLPPLMLEADQFDELVQLALAGDALPNDSEIARRDVEVQRLQFALKAALRSKKYLDAVKLALRAGGVAAADKRQQELLSGNTDLAARFLDDNQLVEQVSRRVIVGGGWTGSEHAYEAALLSGKTALHGDARSKLRSAYEWVGHWSRKIRTNNSQRDQMSDADIAEMQMAEINLHGPESCADQLRRWQPRQVSFRVGLLFVSRLVDAKRFSEIDELALAAGNDLGLLLAINADLAAVGRLPPRSAVVRATRLLLSKHVFVDAPGDYRGEDTRLAAVTNLVISAVRHKVAPRRKLATLLSRYLPKTPPIALSGRFSHIDERRFVHLRAYCLRAALRNKPLKLDSLADKELRRTIRKNRGHDQDVERFRKDIGALLPWHKLWIDIQLDRVSTRKLPRKITEAQAASNKAAGMSYGEGSSTNDEIARLRSAIVFIRNRPGKLWDDFEQWRTGLRPKLYIPTLNRIVRRTSQLGWNGPSLEIASETFQLLDGEKEDAQSKADTYVELARAILPVSETEARQYFDEAIHVAANIGEENLSRWQAIVHLADAAGKKQFDDPKTAYRFARAAELTYDFVVRDKHFDWRHMVRALVGLSPSSVFAIFSRWADRRFGFEPEILPVAVKALVDRGALDSTTALSLLPIDAQWTYPDLLIGALRQPNNAAAADLSAKFFMRYMQIIPTGSENWKKIHTALVDHKSDNDLVDSAANFAARSEMKEKLAAKRKSENEYDYTSKSDKKKISWSNIFKDVDPTTADGINEARQRYRNTDNGYYMESFFRELFKRVKEGKEANCLFALEEAWPIDLHDARSLIEAMPENWASRRAVPPALIRLIKDVYRRSCFSVSADSYYQLLPLDMVTEATGLSKKELMAETVDAIGYTTPPVSADALFRLVGLLAELIPENEAHDALNYGLDLFEPFLGDLDGDGDWQATLKPPTEVHKNLAGYLWARLSSPFAIMRWEAAHVVRGLCQLGQNKVLDALVIFASSGDGGAFADKNLRFYNMHGVQWFVIALARAAREPEAECVVHQLDFLISQAKRDNPQVLIRGFSADALLSLREQGLVELTEARVEYLNTINQSPFEPILSKSFERRSRKEIERSYEDRRFSFDMDFPRYWLNRLGRCFAYSEQQMEIEAENVIRDDWGLDDDGDWDKDERATRKYFRDDWGRNQGGANRKDDLRFYLSYHATMTVAGKLLDREPLHRDPEGDDWYSFRRWLEGQGLTRSDGYWLSDRRDVVPQDCMDVPNMQGESPKSATEDDIIDSVGLTSSKLIVSGWWEQFEGQTRSTVRVASALATSERSNALAGALQSTKDHFDYKLPDFEEDHEIDVDGFVFKGWIGSSGSDERNLDEYDPWAVDISTSAPVPALPFVELLNLEPGNLQRVWLDEQGNEQIWSNVWTESTGFPNLRHDEDERHGNGKRLVANRQTLDRLMRSTGLNLIVEATKTRKTIYSRYDSPLEREKKNEPPITRIFVLRPGEQGIGFRTRSSARRKTGKRVRRKRSV